MYTATTHNITVTVMTEYLPEQSQPESSRYVWAYHVRIRNDGNTKVQLVSRYWKIIDAQGGVQEVRGPGVVGLQPVIRPGEEFTYNSGTHLSTPGGMMMGNYSMEAKDGAAMQVDIPAFSLDIPNMKVRFN